MENTPRERRKLKNRMTILDAAAKLIIQKGVENVSLRDIAKASNYSPAGLYNYFEDKAAIIQAVLQQENQQLLDILKAVPETDSLKERIIKLALLYVSFGLDHPVFLILVNTIPSNRKSPSQSVPEISPYRYFLDAVKNWVEEAALPLPKTYDAEEITYALWAQIHGMATLRLYQLKDFEADFDTVNRKTIEIFLNGLTQMPEPGS
jgi:AcrR family transcriptional regulator